jgi:sarcosine oxidase, subunit gamma
MADLRASARSPVAGRLGDLALVGERTGGRVGLEHVPFLAQVDLRVAPSLAGRAPYPLPLEPNTVWEDGPRAALWLGPDEWLILGPPFAGPAIVKEVEEALVGEHRSVIDVGANRVALELAGPGRFELLGRVCSIDLHPRSWRAGMCAQTLLGSAQVILHERTDTTGILSRPSFADYVIDRLLASLGSMTSGG